MRGQLNAQGKKKEEEDGGGVKVGIRQVRATRAEDQYTDKLRMQS